ncbi:MAG: GNAT family N-acetyltransferase [Acidobacteria bacterium]|nr:GNAT family N-acetyltransferase [Acidobacteriota bacterium]
MPLSPPTKLQPEHRVEGFDCGQSALNDWLGRYALPNQQASAATTFVVCDGEAVVGYYSLAVGAVDHTQAPPRVKKGLARHPIPVMVLARLAVDVRYQGRKIGQGLLKDALLRTVQLAEQAGIRAILVHAKDTEAASFYKRFDFEPSPLDPLQLLLLVKDARKAVGPP